MIMSDQINLNEIERKAYRSTFQDGLIDMQLGLIVICMAFMLYRPETGYRALNIALAVVTIFIIGLFYKTAKKQITQPRLGQVQFGEIRSVKKKSKAIALSVVIFFQLLLLGATVLGWMNPRFSRIIHDLTGMDNQMDLLIAGIGATIVGISMLISAVFEDFLRGYYIAFLMSVAVFSMIYFNQPLIPILVGLSIFIPGLVLLVIFLNKYPIPGSGKTDD